MQRMLIMLLILAAGCAGRENIKPAQAGAVAGLTQPRRLTEGEALYLRFCSGCHGWEGRGDGPMARILGVHPPSLRGPQFKNRYNEAELTAWILLGDSLLTLPDPAKVASTEADISALVGHIKRLPQIDWEEVDKGRENYDSLCAYCHGAYGRGDGILASAQASPPRDLSAPSFQLKTSDDELLRVVSEGKGNMPGVKDVLSLEDIRWVIAYARVLSPGYELYERFCARCHGMDGYPPIDTPDEIVGVPPFPRANLIRVVFDEEYFRTHSEIRLRLWVRHMYEADHSTMPHFGAELDGGEVRKILDYLRKLPAEPKD